jgi:hypothetical protein
MRKPFEPLDGHAFMNFNSGVVPGTKDSLDCMADIANAAIAQDKAEHDRTCAYLRTKIATFYDGTALGEIRAERDQLLGISERLATAKDLLLSCQNHLDDASGCDQLFVAVNEFLSKIGRAGG